MSERPLYCNQRGWRFWKSHKAICVAQRRIASEQSVLFYRIVLPTVAWCSWLSWLTTLQTFIKTLSAESVSVPGSEALTT